MRAAFSRLDYRFPSIIHKCPLSFALFQKCGIQMVANTCNDQVYTDGTVCISILHEPGEDKYGYEDPSERWLPVHTVETILLSVISMLSSPNSDSPANIEAAVRSFLFSRKNIVKILRCSKRKSSKLCEKLKKVFNKLKFISTLSQTGTRDSGELSRFLPKHSLIPRILQ